jgi:hypothetical protein
LSRFDESAQLRGQRSALDREVRVPFLFQLTPQRINRGYVARLGKLERALKGGDIGIHNAHANSKQSSVWMWSAGS